MTYKIPESVLVVLHSDDLQVLLIERADHVNFWQSVTGSRDATDPSLAHTALREVSEETGIMLTHTQLHDWEHQIQYDIYPHWRHRYAPGVTRNTEHWFSACIDRQIPVRLAPGEHMAYQWLPWQEAAQRCFAWSNAQAIQQLAHRTVSRAST